MKAVVIFTVGILCLQGISGIPAAKKSDHLIVDGHDLDTFLDLILNRALKPFAERLIDCTPELQRLSIADVEDVLRNVQDTMQTIWRQEFELEMETDCLDGKNTSSSNAWIRKN